MNPLILKPLEDRDLPLVKEWLYKDYIQKWYDDPEEWLYEMKERKGAFHFIKHFIVFDENNPIGFCQYYDCFEAKEDWYSVDQPQRVFSMDYLIGEETCLGRGLGKEIVRILSDTIRVVEKAHEIVVQPEKENIPSCKALLANNYVYDEEKGYYSKVLIHSVG
ncbi:RimJ/RimL family protein N-acetyltransferase [Hydrogenispora ethanolica]|uniref:RimJ/RimL family protein N-acetyltransferase n=1 Tax=Hydrogenispora ethanolica TaxID=1082276 RepID=A0A4R1QUP9_HYDET|nr:GNAT family N-acetyltransferase [Hydrogenispora ethanolica]TCL54664.1 RimJ/RimL family protein N-acetyltransferase [Hydrogenispora ethanolica]